MPTPDEILLVEARLQDQISPAIKKAGRATKRTLDKMSRDAQKMNQRFTTMTSKILNVKNAIIGLAAVKGIQLLLGSVAKLGDNFDKMSQRLNVTTQFLQEMDFVANLAGTSFQQLEGGMRRLARNANDANDGLAASKRAFDDIGVSVQGANGNLKESEELFNDVLLGLAGLEDKTKQTALAQVLFGRSGASLIPILNQGADAIRAQRKEANELGSVMSTSAIKAAVDYTDSMTRLQFAFRGIQANLVAPALAVISKEIEKFIANGGIEKIKSSIDLLIDVGKVFFLVFGASKIIIIGQAMLTAAAGVKTLALALRALSLNPLLIALTAVATAVIAIDNATRKAADRGLTKFNEISRENQERAIELRKEFEKLAKTQLTTSDVIANSWARQSNALRTNTGISQVAQAQMIGLNSEFEKLTGFSIKSAEGMALNTKAMEENLKAAKELTSETPTGPGGTRPAVDNSAAIQAAEQLAKDVDQIRITGLQRSFAGRMQVLDEQESMLLERARGNEEQLDIIRREFLTLHTEEVQTESDVRLAIEQQHADDLKTIMEKSAEEGKKNLEEKEKRDKKIQDKIDVRTKKDEDIRKKSFEIRKQGERALQDALISEGARGLQGLIKNEKAAQGVAVGASIIQGLLAVQRAIAFPPGPPATLPGALAVGVKAAGNTAAIASQAFADGGFPVGRNVKALLNEQGQESVLNAQATSSLGTGNINRINSGRGGGNIITNEISYSPTLEINSDTNQDFLSVLGEDKERFGKFFNEEIVDKGFLER